MKNKRMALMLAIVLGLVLVMLSMPSAVVIASSSDLYNPGFETGDFSGWSLGMVSDSVDVVGPDGFAFPAEGNYMARLGSSATRSNQRQPKGPNRIYQDFIASGPALSFAYNIFTWDSAPYNHFEYKLVVNGTGSTIASFSQGAWGEGGSLKNTGWREVSLDISGYSGQSLRLTVECGGTLDNLVPTWAYVDLSAPVMPAMVDSSLTPGQEIAVTKYLTAPITDKDPLPISEINEIKLKMYLFESFSCPFVFTWDGSGYQVENDIYSVARGKGQEYTDYLGLANPVVPKDGAYSFEIREIPGEKSYTDQLRLITVDHPAAVNVGVDSDGNVHSYRDAFAPDTAIDDLSENVLPLISARDDNLALDIYHGDKVVLDFSSVNISAGAKLVMKADGFEGQAKGEFTGKTPAIQIQTLQSGQWVTRHEFFPKELWAEGVFDLQPFLTESKFVRLVGVSCLSEKYQRIDYIALDNTADSLTCRVLGPTGAVLNGTTNVLNEVAGSDVVYAMMAEDDILAVTFPFAPLTGESRDFVLVSEGYYELVDHTFYVSTWNEASSSWVERAAIPFSEGEEENWEWAEIDLLPYLADLADSFQVKVENKLDLSWNWTSAGVDQAILEVNGADYPPTSAREADITDILPQILYYDDIDWDALNRWAVIKFDVYKPVNIWGEVVADDGLLIALTPDALTVPGGTPITFAEKIGVASYADSGQTLQATVTFYAAPVDHPEQRTIIGTEQISILVVPPVPGFSQWGIIALASLLGGAIFWLAGRRQVRSRLP